MKFLRTLLLPLLSILFVSGNQVLSNLDNPLLGVSSNVKHTAKTDENAGVCTKQGNPKLLGPVGDPAGRSILHKPEGWITKMANNKQGTKIVNPKVKDGSDYIRFSSANPHPKAPPGQQYNYFERYKNGKVLTKDGQWVCPKTHPNKKDFHIPQDKFEELKPLLDLD